MLVGRHGCFCIVQFYKERRKVAVEVAVLELLRIEVRVVGLLVVIGVLAVKVVIKVIVMQK